MKHKIKKIIFITSFLVLSIYGVPAQTSEKLNWSRLESDTKDFSIAVPSEYQMMADEKGYDVVWSYTPNPRNYKIIKLSNIRYITAYENGASFLIESYKIDNLKDGFDTFSLRRPSDELQRPLNSASLRRKC